MFFLAPAALSIVPGIGGAVAGGTFLASIAPALLQMGLGFGLQLLSKSMSNPGIRGEMERGADVPLSFVLGKWATAGCLEYSNEWGNAGFLGSTPNAYLTQVISLSDIPVKGLDGIWVDGERRTLLWSEVDPEKGVPVEEFRTGQRDHLWVKFYDGTQSSADGFLINTVADEDRPWDAGAVFTGVAYAVVTARISKKLWTQVPQFIFEIDGAPLYDPSRDSTVGGSGPQRWSDPATWGGDGDYLPAVQIYNLLRGIHYDGGWVYGMQDAPFSAFPTAQLIAAIEACRELIDHPDGGQVPRFVSGYEVRVGAEDLGEVVQHLLLAMNARPNFNGGSFGFSPASDLTTVGVLSDADIISTSEQSFAPFLPDSERFNGVSAQYPSPDQAWQLDTAPVYQRPDLEAEDDGQRRLSGVVFSAVSDAFQVQRLQRAMLDEYRRERRHVVTLPPAWQALEVNDVISWTSARNGYVNKRFRVDGRSDLPNLDVVLDLTEVDPSDYDFPLGDYVPPARGSVTSPVFATQVLPGFAAMPATVPDALGVDRLPAILISWNSAYLDDVDAIRVEARVKDGGGVVIRSRSDEVEGASFLLAAGVLPGAVYEVRGLVVTGSARPVDWTEWVEVTTLNVKPGFSDFDSEVQEQVNEALQGAQDAADEAAAASDAADDAQEALGLAVTNLQEEIAATEAVVNYNHDTVRNYLTDNIVSDPGAGTTNDFSTSIGSSLSVVSHGSGVPISTTAIRVTMGGDGRGGIYFSEHYAPEGVNDRTYRFRFLARASSNGASFAIGARVAGANEAYPLSETAIEAPPSEFDVVEYDFKVPAYTGDKKTHIKPRVAIDEHPLSAGDWFEITDIRVWDVTDAVNNAAAVESESIVRADGDTALAADITTVDARVASAEASISTESAARTSADNALASDITLLSSSVGGLSATVTQHSATLVEVDDFATAFTGISATTVSPNGTEYISGFRLTSWADPDGGGALMQIMGDVIVDGSITAQKLVVAYDNNFVDNGTFWQNGHETLEGWSYSNASEVDAADAWNAPSSAGASSPGAGCLRVDHPTNSITIKNSNIFAVTEGDSFKVSASAAVGGSTRDFNIRLRMEWLDADKNYVAGHWDAFNLTSLQHAVFTTDAKSAPTGAKYARVTIVALGGSSGILYMTNIECRRLHEGATLITPGGISTPELAAGAITANEVAAATLTAGNIVANGIAKPVVHAATGNVQLSTTWQTIQTFNVVLERFGDIVVSSHSILDSYTGDRQFGYRVYIGGTKVTDHWLNRISEGQSLHGIRTGLSAGTHQIKIDVAGNSASWTRQDTTALVTYQG